MIRGYAAWPSIAPGEPLVLHVATDAPRFRATFFRYGDGLVRMGESPSLPGKNAPAGPADRDWDWPAYELKLPADWPSGAYLAHFDEPGAAVLFVVRGRGSSRLLYKLPFATYQAYNCTGGACFYSDAPRSGTPPGSRVTLRRPGGAVGGDTHGALDHYDTGSPRQTFAHWDAPFIAWLARRGYAPEFCADLDLHRNAELLAPYRLLLSVGHDEYWSEPMRDVVERFVAAGGNAAFFGANVCWWRIHLVEGETAMVCHQGGPQGALDHWWPQCGARRPEDALTGASYRHGGGWWDGARETTGYFIQDPAHWLFDGTALRAGEVLGRDTWPPLVGYECDGAPLEALDRESGRARLHPEAARCGTPPDYRVLAAAPLDGRWQDLPAREWDPPQVGLHAATMGVFSPGGTVFNAGTTDWAQVLASGQEPRVERITRNVLERLA